MRAKWQDYSKAKPENRSVFKGVGTETGLPGIGVQHAAKVFGQLKFVLNLSENIINLGRKNVQPRHQCVGRHVRLIVSAKSKFKVIYGPICDNDQINDFPSLFGENFLTQFRIGLMMPTNHTFHMA